jgi:hypothetical protein
MDPTDYRKPKWWTYAPGFADPGNRNNVTVYVMGVGADRAIRVVDLQQVTQGEVMTAGQALFELEQIRYESERGEG